MSVTLTELAVALGNRGVEVDVHNATDVVVERVVEDSRTVEAGTIFCAIRGTAGDGHDHIGSAVEGGAVAVLAEEIRTDAVPTLLVGDSRQATAHAAAFAAGDPSRSIDLIGVTGTNGKTTIVTLLAHVLGASGRRAASLGTLTGTLTTAAAPAFQERLATFVDEGVELVAAEISSHALDQRRVDGSRFRLGLFTNLTQDHLDYHADMAEYFHAKARLFTDALTDLAVIDVATDAGRGMSAVATCPVVEVNSETVEVVATSPGSSTFVWRGTEIVLPLGGRFNVANALLVAEAASQLGLPDDDVVAGLESAPSVPGRFEWIDEGQPFGVVVDYSHTPASVEAAVAAADEITTGRVLLVFGAAGDRDPGKRPLMGAAASAADVLYVTSDNPRTEDPDAIIDDVMTGIRPDRLDDTVREPDRRVAIHAAIAAAEPDDVVVIAGKGHEDYQIIGTTVHDFDDRVVAREALVATGWNGGRS